MPSVSRDQRTFLAICEHNPKHARGKCPNMTKKQYREFTTTPTTHLPKKVASAKRGRVEGYG